MQVLHISDDDAAAHGPDPLDEFFWREDETAPALPELGLAAAPALDDAEPEARCEWLTFLLGDEEYGVPIAQVREILKPPALTEVPRAPAHVLGIIMVRGEVVAVFDPRGRLGVAAAAAPARRGRVLVCDTAAGPRALLVDAVSEVVRLPPSTIEPPPGSLAGAHAGYITGIGRDRGRLIAMLDLPALLGAARGHGEEALA